MINRQAKSGSEQEKKVARNVVSSLAITLQDLSVDFRKAQSSYLKSKRRGGGGEGDGGEEGNGRREGEINQNVHVVLHLSTKTVKVLLLKIKST